MARILVLSDLFPTMSRPLGATFIQERISAHSASSHAVDRVDLRLAPKQPLRSLLLLSHRDVEDALPESAPFVGLDVNFAGYLRLRRTPTRRPWAEQLADKVETKIAIADYDVIHAHGMYRVGAGLVAAVLAERHGRPFAVSVHGSDVNLGMPHRQREFAWTLGQARSVMYVSPALQERARELGAPQKNGVVTGNGVDLNLFALGARDRSPEMLFVGGLALVKGADRLPEIFRRTQASVPDARMTIIGVGPLADQIKAATSQLPVRYVGAQSRTEVAAAMRRAAVLVLPSRNEGWPTVINEALASGTPVAATDVGGVRHALAHDEWVVPAGPGPEAALSEVVSSLLTADIDRAGLREQASQHSWTAIARRERAALGID